MNHSASRRRVAATRRRVMHALVDLARPLISQRSTSASLAPGGASHWAEPLAARLAAPVAFQQRNSAPPVIHTPPPRASADFTAQVMARVATSPLGTDPRDVRARRSRARMRRLARVYLTLIIVSGVALVALAIFAPWTLLAALAAIVSVATLALALTTLVSDATDGVISGFGVAWMAMLAALVPLLWLMARQATRGRKPAAHRR